MGAALILGMIRAACVEIEVPLPTASAWPEADTFFCKDPAWVGGDDAYSVDLGHCRVLWLFADSLIDPSGKHSRHGSVFGRNSVAIQSGYNPASASIKFYWRHQGGRPASFFHETTNEWYWPGGGTLIDGHLVIFLMRVQAAGKGALGFKVFGSAAVLIDNPDAEPSEWRTQICRIPDNGPGVVVGSGSTFGEDGHLYAFGSVEPGKHDIYLNRWPLALVLQGRFDDPEWWTGESGGWTVQSRLQLPGRSSFNEGGTEFTVHFSKRFHSYLEFQTTGCGSADVTMRSATNLAGPWSTSRVIYTPPEKTRPRIMIYAGKAHPELAGADLVLTYATNSFELGDVIRDQTLYYPRFIRLVFR